MQLYQLSFPNGKKYIGITSKTAEERFKRHFWRSKKNPCQRAIHKYGKENVVISVLGECDNWELLCLAEREAIEKFNTLSPNGYNLTLGGEGTLGFKYSVETKQKMSISGRNKPKISEETRAKMSLASSKRKPSIETREKMSLSRKKIMSDDIKKAISIYQKGRIRSDEEILRFSLLGKNISEETRAKMSASAKKRVVSQETRDKKSKALKGVPQRPEDVAKRVESRKKNSSKKSLLIQHDIFS